MSVRILVVDDEESICEILKYNLEKDGYEVDTAYSAEEALTLDISVYSLLIVDIMMDKLSGFDLLRKIKNDAATQKIPVMFCSALSEEDDIVMGLNKGSDDYITKPFNINVVLARVRTVLRRAHVSDNNISHPTDKGHYEPDITFKTLRINRNEKQCYIGGEPVSLTRNEFDILLFFLEHRNRIHSREEILKNVWPNEVVTNRAVDVNIARLRRKLGEYGSHITTRLGFGYGFKEEV